MTDIQTRENIVQLLTAFYKKAFSDDLIGRFFTEVVPVNLETHIPKIAVFWEAVVFNRDGYTKNVMEAHAHIHRISAIKKEHLDRWVKLFTETVDEQFAGEKANLMKQRGISVASLMDIKLNHNPINKL